MHPYSIDYATNAFWLAVAARLMPFLGNVETTLGYYWMDEVERCYRRSDFLVVEVAKRTRGKIPDWYIVEWFAMSEDLGKEEGFLAAAETREACVAYIAGRCGDSDLWPDGLSYDPIQDHVMLYAGIAPFAVIRPLGSPATTIASATRSRVETTLLGLQKHKSPSYEFAKRLSRWPGLSTIRGVSIRNPCIDPHLPCPSEWLISARRLWARAGKGEASTAQAQALAAAVLNVPSWNHVTGLLPAAAPRSHWWALYSPFHVARAEAPRLIGDDAAIGVYQDPVEAFLDFITRAGRICRHWGGAEASVTDDLAGMPFFTVRDIPPADAPIHDRIVPRDGTFMVAVSHAEGYDNWLDVAHAIEGDFETGLRKLLTIDT